MSFRLRLIIQDASGAFLAQSASGDVCFTQMVTHAFRFDDLEVATESAEMHCDGFVIFPFYVKESDVRH